MSIRKLILDAKRAVTKVPAKVLGVTKTRRGHVCFLVRLPDGREREFVMSGSPTNHYGAPLALAKDVQRFALGIYH